MLESQFFSIKLKNKPDFFSLILILIAILILVADDRFSFLDIDLYAVIPLCILVLINFYYFYRSKLFLERIHIMEIITFFAGMQALAAFLQVWQTSRNSKDAAQAYFQTKKEASASSEVQGKAERLAVNIRNHPVLGRLLENRFGRCEDEFEEALRVGSNERLDAAAKEFVKCKCLIMQAIQTAQAGLGPDLQKEWNNHNCEVILAS